MKRFGSIVMICIAVLLAVALVACGAPPEQSAKPTTPTEKPPEAKEVVLINNYPMNPDPDPRSWSADQFMKLVNEKGKGKVQIDTRTGLVNVKDQFGAIAKGSVQCGYIIGAYVRGSVPVVPWGTVPGAITWDTIWPLINGGIRDVVYEEFEKRGVKVIFWIPHDGNVCLVSRDKQVKKVGDVEGMRFRDPGALMTKTLELLGAGKVSIPGNEAYEAISKGIVDAAWSSFGAQYSYKVYQVAMNITTFKELMGHYSHYYLMNLELYNSLPADVQKLLMECGREVEPKIVDYAIPYFASKEKEMEDYVVSKGAPKFYAMPKADFDANWAPKLVEPLWQYYLSTAGEPGQKIYDIWKDFQAKQK